MATRLPNGKYRAQVFLGTDEKGKRLYKSFMADTADEADYEALAFKLGHGKRVERKNVTLRAAMRACIESKRGILSPATIQGYEVIERNFGAFLDTPLHQITKISLQNAINQYMFRPRNDGKKGTLSNKSVRNAYGFISSVLKQNDIHVGEILLPSRQEIEYATPFDAQLHRIFEAVKGTTVEIPVLLAVFCSLRRSEICGLRFCDVDTETKAIHVERAKLRIDGEEHVKTTKTKKSRRVVFATDYIISLIEALPRQSEEDYIYPYTPNTITRRFPEILEQHGIPHCCFHELRHSFASVLAAHDVDEKYIQAVGGWSSDLIMKKVYIQTTERKLRQQSESANRVFETIMQQNATDHARKAK